MSSTADQPTSESTGSIVHIHNKQVMRLLQIIWGLLAIMGVISIIAQVVQVNLQVTMVPPQLADLGISLAAYRGYYITLIIVSLMIYYPVAAVVIWRRSDDFMGLFTAFFLVTMGATSLLAVLPISLAPIVADPALQILTFILNMISWSGLNAVGMIFPTGRFVPRWTLYVFLFSMVVVILWNSTPLDSALHPPNWSPIFFIPTAMFGWVVALYAQIHRYRNVSSQLQRQQTKLIVWGIFVSLLLNLITYIVIPIPGIPQWIIDPLRNFTGFSLVFIPLTMGFAIMRFGLFEIDLVINRSLVYGAVTGLLAVIFLASVFVIQSLLGAENTVIAFIISAIGPAVLFNPTRKQVQHYIDRNLYRLRFDLNELNVAQKTLEINNPGALTGQVIGGYEVLDVIGKGGMGEVYKALQDGQIVALKLLAPDLADSYEFRTRFERESQTGQILNHPHIARVHVAGKDNGRYFMAMDYIEGQDLSHYIRDTGPVSPDEILKLFDDLCGALDYAHEQGYVHRDIKSSNVMLRKDNGKPQAILMDFGIAKIEEAGTRFTGTGAIGTIDYMAPEQIMAAREVDKRADIYALGIMLYEMLTGDRPFKGSAAQVMFAQIQQPAPDARTSKTDAPRAMAKAALKAMEKDPNDRFQSAGEMAAALS